MARRRDAGPALIVSREAEKREIVAWYRDLLERTTPPTGLTWEPVKIGPTWAWDDGWVLPERTLGWDLLAWAGLWLHGKRGPWAYTAEQARFILHYYALDEVGDPEHHSAVLQRLKGWGKDPVAAAMGATAMLGPVDFDHFDANGDPVGRESPDAWVQVFAVAETQTRNTMKLMPALFPAETRRHFGVQVGRTNVWALGDRVGIEAMTGNYLSTEGNRPTFVIRNETQNWTATTHGHELAGAIDGNATKRDSDTPARMLDICNAYRPGEDSVAQRVREAWEGTLGDADADDERDRPRFVDFGLLYDSLEAPPEAPLTIEAAPEVVEAVRGDAVWLDIKRIVKSITNAANPPSESRRKWYNQVTAAEDSWTTPQAWDPLARPDETIATGDDVALFLDCSKSDDATGLVACRISDGHLVTLGMWQRPPSARGPAAKAWVAPREKVDAAVSAAMERWRVVAFWGDPSHVLDDETMSRYWDGLFDEWHRRYSRRLKVWAKPGERGHAVMFDMAQFDNQRRFVEAVGQAEADIEAGMLTHDGDARLRFHVLNARRQPTRAGLSIAKDHRESRRKIDLAVCAIGARMARRAYLNANTKRGGWVG